MKAIPETVVPLTCYLHELYTTPKHSVQHPYPLKILARGFAPGSGSLFGRTLSNFPNTQRTLLQLPTSKTIQLKDHIAYHNISAIASDHADRLCNVHKHWFEDSIRCTGDTTLIHLLLSHSCNAIFR